MAFLGYLQLLKVKSYIRSGNFLYGRIVFHISDGTIGTDALGS
jgi:hypothetical protein